MRMRLTTGILTGLLVLLAACSGPDTSSGSGGGERSAGSTTGDIAGIPGDSVSIVTTDGTIQLGLASDTVYMGLTDSVLALARDDMMRDTEETSGVIGRALERFVKRHVSSALQMRLKYAVSDLDSVTYDDSTIEFAYRNRRKMAFEDVDKDGRKAVKSFAPDDAQRFVNLLNSAIRADRENTQGTP